MTDTNPYASPACTLRADGTTASMPGGALTHLVISYLITAYGLVAGLYWHDWYETGRSCPKVDIILMILSPALPPCALLTCLGNWGGGFLPTSKFIAIIMAVLVPWMSLFALFRWLARRG